jgi:CRISPR-associated endonuclease/helicase Cas3
MRGGISRDDGWVRSPAAPTIITGTVDQLGSRLLFRGYGPSLQTAPIHAALAANDSLIVLDEAHCAVPFYQTVKAVERYRAPAWAEAPMPGVLRVVVMSATRPAGVRRVFPSLETRRQALDHPTLRQRRRCKPAELIVARRRKAAKRDDAGLRSTAVPEDELVLDAADRAIRLAASGSQRIAVMVNRVTTARKIYRQLQIERNSADNGVECDLVLMTGRMRPMDRDDLIERWGDALQARDEQPVLKCPVIVVTTQCLEVGADFSFDALITECASRDALRQRFGRLDRFGALEAPQACILIRSAQTRTEEQIAKLDKDGKTDDPIYGNALARTWTWMNAHSHAQGNGDTRFIDFGIDAMDELLSNEGDGRVALMTALSAPAPDAPVMLPSHVDCWVQTAPAPKPDPDIAVFLHGPSSGRPEVHVVLRADLDPGRPGDSWIEALSLCPPSSPEAFLVPLHVLRCWLAGQSPLDDGGDVEGTAVEADVRRGESSRSGVVWRGRRMGVQRSFVTADPDDIRPYDIVVVPADSDLLGIVGDVPEQTSGAPILDIGDRAFLQSRNRPCLRLHPEVLAPWKDHPAVAQLLTWAAGRRDDEHDGDELSNLLSAVADAPGSAPSSDVMSSRPLPKWLRDAARALQVDRKRQIAGYVLTSRVAITPNAPVEKETFVEEDDLTSDSDRGATSRAPAGGRQRCSTFRTPMPSSRRCGRCRASGRTSRFGQGRLALSDCLEQRKRAGSVPQGRAACEVRPSISIPGCTSACPSARAPARCLSTRAAVGADRRIGPRAGR